LNGLKIIERLENHFHQPPDVTDLYARIENVIRVLENSSPKEHLKLIRVKTGSQINFIPASKVVFFKAEEKYTIVKTSDKEYLINTPIKELENELDPDSFWRVHRNSIVNITKIQQIQRSFSNQMLICFKNIDERIKVSRRYESRFK